MGDEDQWRQKQGAKHWQTDRGPSDHHTNGHALEEVDFFSYLGSKMEQTARVERDVGIRLEKAATVRRMWRWKVFKSQNLSKIMKVRVFRSMVMSVLLYGAETWPVTQHDIRRLKTFQMRCLWDIVGVTLWDKRHNTDTCDEVEQMDPARCS